MPPIRKINERIFRFNNQYFYDEEVNIYLIILDNKIVLFDLPTYSQEIEDYLKSFKKPVVAVLSHGSCGIADGRLWQKRLGIKVYLHEEDKGSTWLKMKPDVLFKQPPHISENLEIIHTPGHTPGSICTYEKTTKSLFTGDTFGGEKNGEIWDFFKKDGNGDLKQRLEGCKKLLQYDFKNALPFHYEVIPNQAKSSLKKFIDKYSSN